MDVLNKNNRPSVLQLRAESMTHECCTGSSQQYSLRLGACILPLHSLSIQLASAITGMVSFFKFTVDDAALHRRPTPRVVSVLLHFLRKGLQRLV